MQKVILDTKQRLKGLVEGADSVKEAFERSKTLMTTLTDESGLFVKVSNSYCNFLGYTEAELIGKHFSLIVVPIAKEEVTDFQRRYIKGESVVPFAWTLVKKNGDHVIVFVDAVRVTDDEGRTFKLAILEEVK